MKNRNFSQFLPTKVAHFFIVLFFFTGFSKLNAQGPAVTDIIYGKYMEGFVTGSNTNKVPFFFYAKLDGLTPNATYRYFNSAVQTLDLDIDNGAGIPILVSPSGNFTRVISFDLATVGNYGEFVTNSAGEYTGWFGLEPNSNLKFTAGYDLHMKIILNNGAGGNYEASRLRINNTVRVLDMNSTAGGNNGTAIRGSSSATAKNFVTLYDNVSATGRPITTTVVENDGITNSIANGYASFYDASVNGVNGAWGTLIPNGNASGIKRIEQRSRVNGSVIGCAVDPDGIWTTGSVSTVSPTGGTTALVISATDAPLTTCQNSLYTSATIGGSPFCPGETTTVGFTTVGTFNTGNIFTAQLSDASGSFASPVNIGTYAGVNSWIIDVTIPTIAAGTGYRVRVVSSNPQIIGFDNGNNLTITAAPSITSQPVTQVVCAGNSATFTIVASGTNLTYEWRKDNIPILGATSNSYTISNCSSSDNGLYNCYLTSSGCFTVSGAATLTVNNPPQITTQPIDKTVCEGQDVTLSVSVSTSPNTYQWKKGGVNILGATNYSFSINSVSIADAGLYSVDIAYQSCLTTSVNAVVTVVASPVITVQPVASSTCVGSAVTMSVTAAGSSLTYQWRKGTVDIVGATSATYTIPSATTNNTGTYNCVISSGSCSTTSVNISVVVTAPVAITQQPSNHTICAGQSTSFMVNPADTTLYDYQWTFNGTNIAGAINYEYALTNAATTATGNYVCKISNGSCTTSSNAGILTVLDGPVITTQPVSQSVCKGVSVDFTVTATGSGITYQWKRGSLDIAGATSPTYTIPSFADTISGDFSCFITNGTCSATSTVAHLDISTPALIKNQPISKTVCEGGSTSFLVIATGSSITYQWTLNTVNIQGATLNSFTINNANTTNLGTYECTISSGACSIKTNPVTLTVNPAPPTPVVTNHLDTLISSATTGNQWYDANGMIAGATLQKLKAPNVGSYYVIVTSAQGCKSDSSNKFVYTSIEEVSEKSISIYPNPCKELLTLQLGQFAGKNIQIEIMNILGSTLEKRTISNAKETIQQDVSVFQEGIYFILLTTETKQIVRKLIIKK